MEESVSKSGEEVPTADRLAELARRGSRRLCQPPAHRRREVQAFPDLQLLAGLEESYPDAQAEPSGRRRLGGVLGTELRLFMFVLTSFSNFCWLKWQTL